MPRLKTNDNAIVNRSLIREAVGRYDENKRIYDEAKTAFDAQKRALHDLRNDIIETTNLDWVPVEWAVKTVRQKGAQWCVRWLHAIVMTFAEMGVFDQADLFLVDELVEEIKSTKTVAA